jgi:hypothetical protein
MERILKAFLVGAALPLIYLLAWYGCRSAGVSWPNSWNIPGFLFLVGSYPWSWPAMEYQMELNQFVGHGPRKALQSAAMIIGFGLNVALAYGVFGWLQFVGWVECNETQL